MNQKYLDIAIKSAMEAGAHSLTNFRNIKNISYKQGREIVTNVDRECEEIIRTRILSEFPEQSFLGEESGQQIRDSEYLWIVDPIDGTQNYARGIKHYGISIALARDKQVIVGVVYNPIVDELFFAVRNEGAYVTDAKESSRKLSVSSTDKLSEGLIYISDKLIFEIPRIDKFAKSFRIIASTAYEICQIAAGRIDGCYKTSSNCWGFSAGCLIVEEAQGKVSEFNGEKWSTDSRKLVISNGNLHKELISAASGSPAPGC